MKKRRFSITKEEADIILFALHTCVNEVDRDNRLLTDAYIRWKYHAMQAIIENLENYTWEV